MPFRDLPGVVSCQFRPREYLIRRGEPLQFVYYLKRGVVNREIVNSYGSVLITTIKESGKITGSIVGLLEIFDEKFDGTSHDDFIAATPCVCYRIPVEVCKDFLRQRPVLMEEAFVMSIAQYDVLEGAYSKKKDLTATALLCEFLLTHSEVEETGVILPKKFTNVEIAKHLGIHSVTVSRIINCLRKECMVKRTEEGLFILDLVGVQAYLQGTRRMKYD